MAFWGGWMLLREGYYDTFSCGLSVHSLTGMDSPALANSLAFDRESPRRHGHFACGLSARELTGMGPPALANSLALDRESPRRHGRFACGLSAHELSGMDSPALADSLAVDRESPRRHGRFACALSAHALTGMDSPALADSLAFDRQSPRHGRFACVVHVLLPSLVSIRDLEQKVQWSTLLTTHHHQPYLRCLLIFQVNDLECGLCFQVLWNNGFDLHWLDGMLRNSQEVQAVCYDFEYHY